MKAKEYIKQAYKIDIDIRCKVSQIQGIQKLIESMMQVWEPYATRHYREMSSLQKSIIKLSFMEQQMSEEIAILVETRTNVEETINKLNNNMQQTILKLRYIDGKAWSQIAEEILCDSRWLYRVHVKSLNAIDNILINQGIAKVS